MFCDTHVSMRIHTDPRALVTVLGACRRMGGGSTCGGQTMAKATLLLALAFSAVAAAIRCPAGTDKTDAFAANDGTQWLVCEDLGAPDGGLLLVSGAGRAEHFSKTYEPVLRP